MKPAHISQARFVPLYIQAAAGKVNEDFAREVYQRCMHGHGLREDMLEAVHDYHPGELPTVSYVLGRVALHQHQVTSLEVGAELFFTAVHPIQRGIRKFTVSGKCKTTQAPLIWYTGNGAFLADVHQFRGSRVWLASTD